MLRLPTNSKYGAKNIKRITRIGREPWTIGHGRRLMSEKVVSSNPSAGY